MGTEAKNNKKTKQQIAQAKKSIEKVKKEKTKKKKVLKGATEILKQLPKKKIKKGFFYITPEGGGISNEKIKLEKKGRKITLGSGKLSISKKGKEHELKYGPHISVTKEGKNLGVKIGGKNWGANVYKEKKDSGFKVKRIWRFNEGGLVPKRTFIAIGCGKVMNNRRKKTKIY